MKKIRNLAAFITAAVMLSTSALTVSADSRAYKTGDVNLDGVVNSEDATLLRKALWCQVSLSDLQRTVADVNGDLHVTFADYTALNDICSGKAESADIVVDADENGNVSHYLNNNPSLEVSSTAWSTKVTDSTTGSSILASPYTFNYSNSAGKLELTSFGAGISGGPSSIYYSKYGVTSSSLFSNGSFATHYTSNGTIYDNNSFLTNDSSKLVRKVANVFANTSADADIFGNSDYSDGGTVQLVYADVTRNGNTYEFSNYLGDTPVYSTLSRHDASIDGVTFHYENGDFTYEGIDEDSVVLKNVGVRACNTYEGEHYVELALYTDTCIYGVMYEPVFDMMAALVRYDYDTNEAALVQYVSSVDFSVVSTFNPQDWVLDYVTEHPENTVQYFDDYYDPDHLVFETVMYRQNMKVVQVGKMNEAYKIYDGLTFTQLPTGVNTIVNNHDGENSTLMFGKGIFNISVNAGGVFNTSNIYSYTVGGDSLTMMNFDGSLYSGATSITYKGANFSVNKLLSQRTPTMY